MNQMPVPLSPQRNTFCFKFAKDLSHSRWPRKSNLKKNFNVKLAKWNKIKKSFYTFAIVLVVILYSITTVPIAKNSR